MPNAFFLRPKIIAGSVVILLLFLLDFSGKQNGGDEQAIRRLRADFNAAIAAHDSGGGDDLPRMTLRMFGNMK